MGDPDTTYIPFIQGAKSIALRSVLGDEVVVEVPLRHKVTSGMSSGDMAVSIGKDPQSMIIISNIRHPEHQQLVKLSAAILAAAISPQQDMIAASLGNGLQSICFDVCSKG